MIDPIYTEDELAEVAPPKRWLPLARGVEVIVLTAEGAVKRGRRRWHPGRTVGSIFAKHSLHDRCWKVRVNGMTVLLFEDEMDLAPTNKETLTA